MARAPDGRVVFVRHSAPGELVRARITEDTRRYLRADAVEVVEPSPDRVTPPCPHAGPGGCGGCDWQHVDLAAQRRGKAEILEEHLRRLAGLDVPVTVEPVPVPGRPDDGLGWRSRIQLAAGPDGRPGFHRHRSSSVAAIDRCPITAEHLPLDAALGRRWPAGSRIELVAVGSGSRLGVRPHSGGTRPRAIGWDPPGPLTTEVAGRRLRVSPASFWQPHRAAPEVLAAAVAAALGPKTGDHLLDLYAGVGLFASVLGPATAPGGAVTVVEASAGAAADARENLAGLPGALVLTAPVDRALRQGLPRNPDLVVLDPPRAGAGPAVAAELARLRPRRLAYVSCDGATLARDLAVFLRAGWRVVALRAFDLFPMTEHVEVLAVCEPPVDEA